MINVYGLNETNFRRLMAHELLHHWWTHFKKFEKLKWKVIRDRISVEQLADGLSTGPAATSNRGCSAGIGHERHNPEHAKVCGNENNY